MDLSLEGREFDVMRVVGVFGVGLVKALPPLSDAIRNSSAITVEVLLMNIRGLSIQRIFRVDLVKDAPGVEQHLPYVINVSFPLVKASTKVQLEGLRVHDRVEDEVVENEFGAIAVGKIFGNEEFESEDALLIHALSDEEHAEPDQRRLGRRDHVHTGHFLLLKKVKFR